MKPAHHEKHDKHDKPAKRNGSGILQRPTRLPGPQAVAMRECAESAAGIDEAPGSVSPKASIAIAIVDAVPIVMHVPKDRAIPSSISRQLHSSSVPARRSAQYFHTSLPEPRN